MLLATRDWREAEGILKDEPFTREGVLKTSVPAAVSSPDSAEIVNVSYSNDRQVGKSGEREASVARTVAVPK